MVDNQRFGVSKLLLLMVIINSRSPLLVLFVGGPHRVVHVALRRKKRRLKFRYRIATRYRWWFHRFRHERLTPTDRVELARRFSSDGRRTGCYLGDVVVVMACNQETIVINQARALRKVDRELKKYDGNKQTQRYLLLNITEHYIYQLPSILTHQVTLRKNHVV